jgi:transposase
MIQVEDREVIRRAYYTENKSVRRIARELGHSRKTVRKAIASAEPVRYVQNVPREAPVLGPHKGRIDELLAENEDLPRKQRYTSHKIYEAIEGDGYRGAESTVRGYVAMRRKEKKRWEVFIPLEFDPGTDGQVDWGEAVVEMGGERITVELFVMRLCYSRRLFTMAFPAQKQEAFFEGHVRAFHFFGGVPRRLSYDNLKTAVHQVLRGRNRKEQESFIVFRSHYLFESHFCTPGQAHEKGRVEDGVGFARRNFLVPIPQVSSYAELNAHLEAACLEDDQRRVDRQKMTIGEAWKMEKPRLLPLPNRDFECCVTKPVVVNRYGQVEFETNRYSVPAERASRNMMLKAYPFRVDVLHLDEVVASHPRCYDRQQDILDPLHYLVLVEQRPGAFDHAKPLRRWRESWPPVYERLLAELRSQWPDGRGIREFVSILKLHRDHPADLVSEAVSQALEWGCAHADGVQLCLRQLTHPEQPTASIELANWPELVNVGIQPPDLQRYDRLLERV